MGWNAALPCRSRCCPGLPCPALPSGVEGFHPAKRHLPPHSVRSLFYIMYALGAKGEQGG